MLNHIRNYQEEMDILQREHTRLDKQISSLEQDAISNEFELQKLKKQKLQIKDKIFFLESQIYPDIIA